MNKKSDTNEPSSLKAKAGTMAKVTTTSIGGGCVYSILNGNWPLIITFLSLVGMCFILILLAITRKSITANLTEVLDHIFKFIENYKKLDNDAQRDIAQITHSQNKKEITEHSSRNAEITKTGK
jgi:hypothetical protein